MDACIPENPTMQCLRCLRRHGSLDIAATNNRRDLGLRDVVIDGSTLLVEGRCQFRVDSKSLGLARPDC